MAKGTKHGEAIMEGILVTKFKMGLIDIEDLELMAMEATMLEGRSAAKSVLEAAKEAA
jgi:hypothetical protein